MHAWRLCYDTQSAHSQHPQDSGEACPVSGKGSASRPKSVDDETFGDNWERTFGKPEPAEDEHVEKQRIRESIG